MALNVEFLRSTMLAAVLAPLAAIALAVSAATPARADRCDDIANQLRNQIDGLKVGITAGNVVYLSHPSARELSLGCANRSYSNELYAKADGRKAKKEFVDRSKRTSASLGHSRQPKFQWYLDNGTQEIQRFPVDHIEALLDKGPLVLPHPVNSLSARSEEPVNSK